MKQFILRSLLFVVIPVIFNTLIGIIRICFGDRNIPFEIHQFESARSKPRNNAFQIRYEDKVADLSGDTIKHIKTCKDEFGFSNVIPVKNPDIIYIGDSYFADMLFSVDSGVQAVSNRMLGYPACYNLGYPDGSNFIQYNELVRSGFITQPKIIVLEIAERNLHKWEGLKDQLLSPATGKKTHSYYGLDLVLGNNFSNLSGSKLFGRKVRYGRKRIISGKPIYFIENKLTMLSVQQAARIIDNMAFAQRYFAKRNIRIFFVVAPDKESLYPAVFGKSQLNGFCDQAQAKSLAALKFCDTLATNPRQFYFDGDLHWNQLALKTVLGMIRAHGMLDTARTSPVGQ